MIEDALSVERPVLQRPCWIVKVFGASNKVYIACGGSRIGKERLQVTV